MGRAPCCDKNTVKRGPWSPEEDATLKKYIEKNGHGGNWIALPQKAGLNRCGKSCRLRWLNYLRPNIRHGDFTEDEDNIICTLYKKIGSRWSVIASKLNGRTDNDVKNYWNTKLKRKLIQKRQTNIIYKSTNNNVNLDYQPSPTPQLPATLVPTTKTEDYNSISRNNYSSTKPQQYCSIDFSQDLITLQSGLVPFWTMKLEEQQTEFSSNMTKQAIYSSVLGEVSAASSSCTSSFSDWTSNKNDLFLSQFSFGEADDFVNNYGYQDMLGEELMSSLGNIWSDIENEV